MNLRLRKIVKRSVFVLSVGDEGAILTYFKGKKLVQRLFSPVNYNEGMQAFTKLLASNPKAPVYILLDIADQSYTQQSLPAVSSLTINKLVKKRLERDFSPEDIKGALPLGREKAGRKDWQFIFVSSHVSPPLSLWLDFCLGQKNPIAGICMVPVEAEHFQQHFNEFSTLHKDKTKTAWQFLVLHTRVGGFRQVVFHNGRIVFSRLVASSPQELPGVVAGHIEQEILNSMEYLRRLGLPDEVKMDILICVSAELKRSFEISTVKGHRLIFTTPYEIAQKFGLTKAVQPNDQFCDVLFAADFIQQRPVLKLHSMVTRHLAALYLLRKTAKAIAIGVVLLMLVAGSMDFWKIWDLQQEINQMQTRKEQINQRWVTLQANAKQYDEESTVIRDMVMLNKLLSSGSYSPLATFSLFNSVKGNNVVVKNIDWKLIESSARGDVAGHSVISMNLSVDFYNEGESLDRFFASFDQLIKRLETAFSDYNIEYSQLPEKVTVGQVSKVIPVEIKILGPHQ